MLEFIFAIISGSGGIITAIVTLGIAYLVAVNTISLFIQRFMKQITIWILKLRCLFVNYMQYSVFKKVITTTIRYLL